MLLLHKKNLTDYANVFFSMNETAGMLKHKPKTIYLKKNCLKYTRDIGFIYQINKISIQIVRNIVSTALLSTLKKIIKKNTKVAFA